MLVELTVRGLGVIEDATITFGPGLTTLTGETGAGKTLLVDALAIVLGGRPPRGLVQPGGVGYVEATFLRNDQTEVILAREIPSEGRAKAWVDGRAASLSVVTETAAGLCDIYGQHEHQTLLAPGAVRRSLDQFAGIDGEVLRAARSSVRQIEAERDGLGGNPQEIERDAQLLEHQISMIDAAQIVGADELDRLLEEASLLGESASILDEIDSGLFALTSSEVAGPRDVVAKLRSVLEGHAALSPTAASLAAAEAALDEAVGSIRQARELVTVDPARSQAVDERISTLHGLLRIHGPSLADVIRRRDELGAEAARLRSSLEQSGSIEDRLAGASAHLAAVSERVEAERRAAAPHLLEALRSRLADLALGRAEVDLTVDGPAGDKVELLFSANRGHAPQPVSAAASGGELARLMLSLRLILPGGPACMVFDEVDAGIGGSTALVLADALAEVATHQQVLVVTHLAQVAASGASQVGVTKVAGDRDTAVATTLGSSERVKEIARMLSGHPDSPAARAHAQELLNRTSAPAQLPLV